MATETSDGSGVSETSDSATDGVSPYMRSITVTTVATLAGIAAGIGSHMLTAGPSDTLSLAVLVAAIVVQFPIYSVVGIDTSDFSAKDQIYIAFMTFVLWFVSWSILMTTGAL
jgi:hypothetical protein